MQRVSKHLLNLPRSGTISGVQNLTLYSKIAYSNQIVRMDVQMVAGPRAIENTNPLFLYPIEPEISTPEKSAFAAKHFQTY